MKFAVIKVLVQTSDLQTSDRTNVGLTNIRPYKRRTGQRSDSTNVGLVQTSDWYKRQTVQTSDYSKKKSNLENPQVFF